MKIRLVYPNPDVGLSGRRVESAALQLLAALTPREHEVSIFQEHLGDPIDFEDQLDLVGITAMTIQAKRAYAIADEYRKRGKLTVLGGIHPSVCPQEALQHADAVVVGEAESVWPRVLADALAGRLRGIYRGADLVDLSDVPPFRRDCQGKNRSVFSLVPVQAARGCPYDCSFCSATLFTGRKYRFRPVENVIAEIKAVKSGFVFFVDDNIFSNEAYCRALFTELRKLDIIWVGQASMQLTAKNVPLLKLAVESGCASLFVGIESLSQSNLRGAGAAAKNGNSTPEEVADNLRVLHDHGVLVMAGVIFGFDDDDPDVFDRTRDFLNRNRVGHGSFSTLTPFPGTKLFDALHASSRILTYDWSRYDGARAVFRPRLMTPEELEEGTRKMGVNFYSMPNILRRFWVNRHHPGIYLATSFAWRHACRVENKVPFYRMSGAWKAKPVSPAPSTASSTAP